MRYYEALRCLIELAWVGELRMARAGLLGPRSGFSPWDTKRPREGLISHFRKITGITLALPPEAA